MENITVNRFKTIDKVLESRTQPDYFYQDIWYEGTTCLLHAPKSVDKQKLASEIAVSLSNRDHLVVYLSASKVSDKLCEQLKSARNLILYQSKFASPDDPTDFTDIVLKDIEDAIKTTGAKVFVIDSLTRIAALSFGRNASPAYIMKQLVTLQMRYDVSFLIINHNTSPAATRTLVSLADCEIALADPEAEKAKSKKGEKKATDQPKIANQSSASKSQNNPYRPQQQPSANTSRYNYPQSRDGSATLR